MKLLRLIWLLVVWIASEVNADVQMQNGNFYLSYDDIVFEGGLSPRINRVYNSKSTFKGMFGHGWGSEFEIRLSLGPGGKRVLVNEWGSGAENVFSPAGEESVDGTPKMEVEANPWKVLSDIPVGTRLESLRFGRQTIDRTDIGFVRSIEGMHAEYFDNRGLLRRIEDRNGNFIDFDRNTQPAALLIKDNFGRQVRLVFNRRGLVEQADGGSAGVARYRYSEDDELVYSKDTDGHVYVYRYSGDRRHNLAGIGYQDGTQLSIYYYPVRMHKEGVYLVKDRDGSITKYKYHDADSSTEDIRTVTVETRDGGTLRVARYQYHLRKEKTEEWLARLVEDKDGKRTDTTYTQCCGHKPERISRGEVISFEYDNFGRITRKETNESIEEHTYDGFGRKTSISISSALDPDAQNKWSRFSYDDRGNLTSAQDSSGRSFKVGYDQRGRIITIADNIETLQISYGSSAKPASIRAEGKGVLRITYEGDGVTVKKVEGDRRLASSIAAMMSGLSDVIQPAGVALSLGD